MAVEESKKAAPLPRLALGGAKEARGTLARLARMRFRHEIDSETFRDLVYCLSMLRSYNALLADIRIEERLGEIEKALAAEEDVT